MNGGLRGLNRLAAGIAFAAGCSVASAQPIPSVPPVRPGPTLPEVPPVSSPPERISWQKGLPDAKELDALARRYRRHWEDHPNGQWLLRILPVRLMPSDLPEAASPAARLTARYCVQCHALPAPAMHGAPRWEQVVRRMLPRMRGEGNQGRLMHEMMQGLQAPDVEQVRVINDYLARHARQPLTLSERDRSERDRRLPPSVPGRPALSMALAGDDGRMFRGACGQCHELPDPAAHRAAEWPAVVARMQENMLWMNRVVGTSEDPREPRLDPQRITAFLQAFASDALSRSEGTK